MRPPRSSDAVVLVGLNPDADQEAKALRQMGNHVTLITTSRVADWVYVGGRGFNLSEGAGALAFLKRLNLERWRIEAVEKVISNVDRDMKDEFGQLAMMWAHFERSGVVPGRLVISGEHVGGGYFWRRSTMGGEFRIADLGTLAAAFPRVAHAIEDLHTSACNSANEALAWPRIFPRLKTIWAYAGSCPGTFSGAARHLALWDRATRGPVKTLDRLVAKGTRKGGNVVVWTPRGGLVTGEVHSLEELRVRIVAAREVFEHYFGGDLVVENPQEGPLREYYDVLQAILRDERITEAERTTFEKRRDVTIRLLYYESNVKGMFARVYSGQIASGHVAVGLAVPDFSSLSRKAAAAVIEAFEQRANVRRIEAAEQLRPILTEGLLRLSPRYISPSWL